MKQKVKPQETRTNSCCQEMALIFLMCRAIISHSMLTAPEQLTGICWPLQKYHTWAMRPSLPVDLLPADLSPFPLLLSLPLILSPTPLLPSSLLSSEISSYCDFWACAGHMQHQWAQHKSEESDSQVQEKRLEEIQNIYWHLEEKNVYKIQDQFLYASQIINRS